MKVPTPKKLPSGSWRIQLMVNGKKYSITDKDQKVCKQRAKEIYAGIEQEKRMSLTVGQAIDKYIEAQEGTLSPSTLSVYRRYRRNYLQLLMSCALNDLTLELIQLAISKDSQQGKSPKTIRNAYGLLTATLKLYRPKFKPESKLPQKEVHEIVIPTEAEMKQIWAEAKGTKYEIPILLASWLGLRMSEVRGLKYADFKGNQVHIQRAVVRTSDGDVEKKTKSYSGDRWITCPKYILDLLEARENKGEYVCRYSESTIYNGFVRVCERAGVQHYRFHDLRHFAASEAHSLGIPDKYQMKRMGHKTDNMLKNVYQHTIRDKEDTFATLIDDHMTELLA